MRKTIAATAAGLALFGGTAAIASTGLIGVASAQESGKTQPQTQPAGKDGRPGRQFRRQVARAAVKVSAETIGMQPKDLVKEVREQHTSIAAVATEHGVDPQTVIDALVSKANAKIDSAVANGKLTQERADALKAKVPDIASKIVNHKFTGEHHGKDGNGQTPDATK